MKICIKSLFHCDKGNVIERAINKEVEITDTGNVLDKNNNGWRNIPYLGKLTKVELKKTLEPRNYNADNLSASSFISEPGANAILRNQNGGIQEAIINILEP